MFPIIKIRNKGESGQIRKHNYVGFDRAHHRLLLDENGNIKFLNLQSYSGTGKHGDMEFVSKVEEAEFGVEHHIEFGTIFEVLNIYSESINIDDNKLSKEFNDVVFQLKEITEKAEKLNAEKRQKILDDMFELFSNEEN